MSGGSFDYAYQGDDTFIDRIKEIESSSVQIEGQTSSGKSLLNDGLEATLLRREKMTPNDLIDDLRSRINPAYAATLGTDSYERRLCAEALEALLAERAWLPIETAPKDGSHLQLFRPEIQFVGYYGGAESGWRINAPGLPAMWPEPTHWAPLRKAPNVKLTSPPNSAGETEK